MKKLFSAVVLPGVALLALAACNNMPPSTAKQLELAHGQYWQRAETSSSIYQRGPKAQQMLHRDIAKCTYEVRELQRIGALRNATPADPDASGRIPDPATPEGRLSSWDTPERDGYLYAEHSDFHDFETCMIASGWERVEYLPYDVATEARETYIDTMNGEKRRTRSGGGERKVSEPVEGDFGGLNQ